MGNIPKEVPEEYQEVVTDCWSKEITKRPTFQGELKNQSSVVHLRYRIRQPGTPCQNLEAVGIILYSLITAHV